ncbi:MAG: hypothetical protein HZA32_21375 [Opitutae bacterium]|nr:hypothetical protein [Opitutae bacterium]
MNRFLILFAFSIFVGSAHAEKRFKDDSGNELVVLEPADVLRIFDAAVAGVSEFEIISLDPARFKEGDAAIDGATITGRSRTQKKEEIERMVAALRKSIREAPEETYECFEPRHALRAQIKGRHVEIVLCFECLQGIIRVDKDVTQFPMTADAEKAFDEIFAQNGLKKAEKKRPNKSAQPTPGS